MSSDETIVEKEYSYAPCACGRKGRFGCGRVQPCPRTKDFYKKVVLSTGSPVLGKEPDNVPEGMDKFSMALKKAYRARVLKLERHLSRVEVSLLKKAVRKQCCLTRGSKLSRAIGRVSHRVDELEKACPIDSQSLQAAIENAYSQVNVLRSLMVDRLSEADEVSEGCVHFKDKPLYTAPTSLTLSVAIRPPFEVISCQIPEGKSARVACTSCSKKREDLFFSWYGEDPPSFETSMLQGDASSVNPSILQRGPLCFPTLWSAILDERYQRA